MENGMELPVLLITQGVLFPEAKIKVPIRSKNNLAMLDRFVLNRSIASKTLILVAYRTETEKKVYDIGTVAMIEQVSCFTSSTFTQYTLHIVGVSRAKILDYALPVSRVKQIYSTGDVSEEKEQELYEIVRKFERSLNREESITLSNAMRHMIPERHVDEIVDLVASFIPRLGYERQLEFLATVDVPTRVDAVIEWCKKHLETNPPRTTRSASPSKSIALHDIRGNGRGRGRMIHNNHEEPQNPIEKLAAKLEAANLPEDVRDRVFEDLNRVKSSGGNGQESSMLLSYLEFVADLPWSMTTKDDVDIKKARQLLDDSHEGMENVKKRVLEYIAVRSLRDDGSGKAMAGPILCFAGPPGVGKTSVARAIAQSLGRKFERISLGGIRDEADIRGHRRTYIGAMPGRLLQAIRRSKTRNPVILLDEVDKLFSGVHGSPSAALLEVLDPEQNGAFMDHHNRKTIIQDFYNERAEFTETRAGHICPSSDVIFSLQNEDAERVWVTGSFLGWQTLVEMRRDPRRTNEWRVRLTLPHGHHQFRFVVDGMWHLRDGLTLECDDKGQLCHYMHLPIDERRRRFERLQQSKRRAQWNMEKGEFIEAKDIYMYR